MSKVRYHAIDVVRGLAIMIMVPANMAAGAYAEPHALWFRVFSSFAAPLFIGVSGMMISLSRKPNEDEGTRYLKRGAMLLAVGAVLDAVVWQLVPFVAFDVLYLIGIACPITYSFTRLRFRWQVTWIILILAATPVSQVVFGYSLAPVDHQFAGIPDPSLGTVPITPTSILRHLVIDGWFPLLPWMAVMFGGAVCGSILRADGEERGYARLRTGTVVLLASGTTLWILFPGDHAVRAGYSEMFYPPTVGFVMTGFGLMLAILGMVRRKSHTLFYAPIRWLGEASLAMYILHFVLIRFVVMPRFQGRPFPEFFAISSITTLALIAIALGLRELKHRWPNRPFAVRFLLGG